MSKRVIRVCLSRWCKPAADDPHGFYNLYALERVLSSHEVILEDKVPYCLLYSFGGGDTEHLAATHHSAVQVLFSGENLYRYIYPTTESWVVFNLLRHAEKVFFLRRLFTVIGKWLILHYAPEKWWYRYGVLLRMRYSRRFYKFISGHTLRGGYSVLSNASQATARSVSLPYGLLNMKVIERGYQVAQHAPPRHRKFCCIMASNVSSIPRLHFFMRLSRYKQVDFYGHPAFRNTDCVIPHGFGGIMRSGVYTKYKFVICFENSSATHYLTEKLVMVLYADSIPIYWGDPCVGEYFNSERMIAYSDYKSFDKMMDKVIELDRDHEKYRAFVAQPKQTPANIRKVEAMWSSYYAFMAKVLETVTTQKEKEREADL